MEPDRADIFRRLVAGVAGLSGVESIGLSGGGVEFPVPGPCLPDFEDGDIDLFVYGETIPGAKERQALMDRLSDVLEDVRIGAIQGGVWGIGDFACIGGVETCVMYFTTAETRAELDGILAGRHPDRDAGGFFPTGRCAMYRSIRILHDRTGYLARLRESVRIYPETLAEKLTQYHLDRLADPEDLERGVARRDPLFYHHALDRALDHFLQALFAMNRCFFPSRKRSLAIMESFHVKPNKCAERLLAVVADGGLPDGIRTSFDGFQELSGELRSLACPSDAITF
ncbi:MAG: DUF4037 domain-containing protein [Clostridia bacterium]|nr:DUF4037 domain-containing protein [Clostridia bacterium]